MDVGRESCSTGHTYHDSPAAVAAAGGSPVVGMGLEEKEKNMHKGEDRT